MWRKRYREMWDWSYGAEGWGVSCGAGGVGLEVWGWRYRADVGLELWGLAMWGGMCGAGGIGQAMWGWRCGAGGIGQLWGRAVG